MASPKEGRRRWSISSRLLPLLLPLLLLLPAPDPLHIVAGVFASLLAIPAQVVVIADDALVSEPDYVGLVTSIAGHAMVSHIRSNSSRILGRLFKPLGTTHSCRQLVDGACQLGQCQDQLLVSVYGDRVAILVSPRDREEFFREDGKD